MYWSVPTAGSVTVPVTFGVKPVKGSGVAAASNAVMSAGVLLYRRGLRRNISLLVALKEKLSDNLLLLIIESTAPLLGIIPPPCGAVITV